VPQLVTSWTKRPCRSFLLPLPPGRGVG
jgi:hypothetical protein